MGSDGWVEHSNEMQKYRFPRIIVFWVGGITTDIGLHERVLDTYQGIVNNEADIAAAVECATVQ